MKFYGSLRSVEPSIFMLLAIVGITVSVLIIPEVLAQLTNQATVTPNFTFTGIQSMQTYSDTSPHIIYNTSYQNITADSSNTLTIQTDKRLYKPGDLVKVQGAIWSGLIATVGGINTVSLQFRDINDTVIYSGKSHLNDDGSYLDDIQLPSDVKNGWYTLEAKADVSQDVLNTLTLRLQAGLDTITKFVVITPHSWPIKINGMVFEIKIASTSNTSNVNFDTRTKQISFTVTGQKGTEGVTDITIPKSLLSGSLTVMMDRQPIPQNEILETDTQDSTTFEINYYNSSHEIEIVGTNALPEFPASIIIFGVAISSFLIFNLFSRVRKTTLY